MKKTYILVIDAGTGAVRVLLFDLDGTIIHSNYREWSYKKYPENVTGALVFEAEEFWQIIAETCRTVILNSGVDPADIAAVTTTSQRQGMVFLNRDGGEIYAAPNMDLRGADVVPDLERWRDEIFSITGLPLHGMFGLARLRWFSKHDTAVYDQIAWVMMISDWICYRLSGVCASEPSIAGSSQLFDVETSTFSTKLLDLVDLRSDIFPPVHQAGTLIGKITSHASGKTDIPAGIPVMNGGGDTQAGVLGMGLYHPGQLAIIAGTTTPIISLAGSPNKYPDTGVQTINHVIPGSWCIEANAGSTGFSYRWARDLFLGDEQKDANAFTSMEKAASEIPIGADGMLAYIGMELTGSDPGQNLGGFIFPVPWDITDISAQQFYRAALETNIFSVRANIDHLTEITGNHYSEIHLCGGQSRSGLFAQGLADVTGLPVKVYKVREASALGACLSAACGMHLFPDIDTSIQAMVHLESVQYPGAEASGQYKNAYDRWLKFYRQVLSSYRM
jgi:autoinducer 2 (AI-2) kinase